MSKANYIMIGGFLGAGKTTAILKLARRLRGSGLRVGLITNDQSYGLVDSALLRSRGFPVEEITGGCFCCKFNSLLEASKRLSVAARPEAFIAEPVGSCTDLKATVSYPLRRMYGDSFRIAPLSVLVDPLRALRILGLEEGRAFSSKVLYVYRKQLEEAETIVINKADLLAPDRLECLRSVLASEHPQAEIFVISARNGNGLEPWFDRILGRELGSVNAPELDYELYAEGEALLGWLNCTVLLSGSAAFDGNALLCDLAHRIGRGLLAGDYEVAHLKMTLSPDEDGGDIGVCNLVRGDAEPEQSHRLQAPLERGELILNLRAESDPEELRGIVLRSLQESAVRAGGVDARIEHMEHFRPARPVPTHRMAGLQEQAKDGGEIFQNQDGSGA